MEKKFQDTFLKLRMAWNKFFKKRTMLISLISIELFIFLFMPYFVSAVEKKKCCDVNAALSFNLINKYWEVLVNLWCLHCVCMSLQTNIKLYFICMPSCLAFGCKNKTGIVKARVFLKMPDPKKYRKLCAILKQLCFFVLDERRCWRHTFQKKKNKQDF